MISIAILAAGLTYLLWPISGGWREQFFGSALRTEKAARPGEQSPKASGAASGEHAGPSMDDGALREWCRQRHLPDPPDLMGAEAGVAQQFLSALRDAVTHPGGEAWGRLGMLYESLEAHAGAEECFARAANADPKDFRWVYFRGCIQQHAGRVSEAVPTLERAQRLNPQYPTTYARLGQLQADAGRWDEAEKHFQKYAELAPGDSFGWLGLGRVRLQRGDAAAALSLLHKAESLGPRDFQVQYQLGRAYQALGQTDRAEMHFAKLRKLPQGRWFYARDPQMQDLRWFATPVRAMSEEFERAMNGGDYSLAAELAERIIARRPDDVGTICQLALVYRKLSRLAEAHALVDRAFALDENSARAHAVRSDLLFAEKRHEEALAAADRAIERDPDSALAHGIRGRSLMMMGRLPEAEASLRTSVDLKPGDASTIVSLGEALRLQQRNDEALVCYRRALEVDPNNTAARERVRQLTGE